MTSETENQAAALAAVQAKLVCGALTLSEENCSATLGDIDRRHQAEIDALQKEFQAKVAVTIHTAVIGVHHREYQAALAGLRKAHKDELDELISAQDSIRLAVQEETAKSLLRKDISASACPLAMNSIFVRIFFLPRYSAAAIYWSEVSNTITFSSKINGANLGHLWNIMP